MRIGFHTAALTAILVLAGSTGAFAQDPASLAAGAGAVDPSISSDPSLQASDPGATSGGGIMSSLSGMLPGAIGAAAGGFLGYRYGGTMGAAIGGIGGFLAGEFLG